MRGCDGVSHVQFETSLGRKLYLRMSQEEIVGGFKDEDYKDKNYYFEYLHRDVVEQCSTSLHLDRI